MKAYWPTDATAFALIAAVLLTAPLIGLAIVRRGGWRTAWLQVVLTTGVVERLSAAQPAGFRMLALCLALLWTLKTVVTVAARQTGMAVPAPRIWLGFVLFWLGMRPSVFATVPRPRDGGARLVIRGTIHVLAGVAGLWLARMVWLAGCEWDAVTRWIATAALALPALSLVLHFGIAGILAGLWRLAGYDCRALCQAPLRSRSLTEFWGQRWNRAFMEMTTLAFYRPLRAHVGVAGATLASFTFSGLLHELAISVPVGAGYGGPTLYFILHGFLVLLEKHWPLGPGWAGRLWTLAWLVIPLPVLFHPWFLAEVVWPLIG